MSKEFSPADVAQHNSADNLYIIVDNGVYNVTGTPSTSYPPLYLLISGTAC